MSERLRMSIRSNISRGSINSRRGAPCPPGLEVLIPLGNVIIKQKTNDNLHLFTGYETRNKYILKTIEGKKIFWAIESTDECVRCCFTDSKRPFELHIFNENKRKVLKLSHPLSWFEPITQLHITIPSITSTIGRIENRTRFFHRPLYVVKDEKGDTSFCIRATSILQCNEFKIRDIAGQEVGRIGKQSHMNTSREVLSDNYFGVEFPVDLDVKAKAILLSACIWLNMKYNQS